MDQFTIAAVDDMHGLGLDRTAAAMLMIESDMPGVAADDELVRAEAACVGAGATSTIRSQTPAEADMLRQARRMAHYALERLGDVKMEDIGVPRARVPDMLREVARIAAKHGVRMGAFGHAGDGNLHPDLVLERGDPRAEAITKADPGRPLPGRAGPRWDGDGRARHRLGAHGVAGTARRAPTPSGSCGRSRPRWTRRAS